MSEPAGVGLSVTTGHAVVVVLRGTQRQPEIVVRYEISLADPWVPESLHPYHRELGDTGADGIRARRRGCLAAQRATHRAVRTLVGEIRSHRFEPSGVGVVVARVIDPASVMRPHPRAHAEEGRLYREAVEAALRACNLRFATIPAKSLRTLAASRLRRSAQEIHSMLKVFSHSVGTPWRGLEKDAALAAWLSLPSTAAVRRVRLVTRHAKKST